MIPAGHFPSFPANAKNLWAHHLHSSLSMSTFFSFCTENSLQQSSPWEFALRRQPAYEMRCAGALYRIPSSTLKHLLATLRMEYLQRRTMAFPFPTYARLQMTNICSRFLPAAQQKTHTNTNTHSDSWAASMANYLLMSAKTEIKMSTSCPKIKDLSS